MPSYHIRISGDDLTFAAGHFITLENGQCERLHGHTYRVAAEIAGPLDANQCVVDFIAVRDALKAILAELDHRMLLPTQHPTIRVTPQPNAVEAAFDDRRWTFPPDDCRLLPIVNTTTELLAHYVGERLHAILQAFGCTPSGVRIEIAEGAGSTAVCQLP